jgi:hypothetical protein
MVEEFPVVTVKGGGKFRGYYKLILQSFTFAGNCLLPYSVGANVGADQIDNFVYPNSTANATAHFYTTSPINIKLAGNKEFFFKVRFTPTVGGSVLRLLGVDFGTFDGTNRNVLLNFGFTGSMGTPGVDNSFLIPLGSLNSDTLITNKRLWLGVTWTAQNTSTATVLNYRLQITRNTDDSYILIPVEEF